MPRKNEKEWQRAKRLVKKQYPGIKEGSPRFYKLVQAIFQNIIKPKSKLEAIVNG